MIQATDGEQAERLAQELRPAPTVLDLRMPMKDGFEVAGTLHDADLPSISLSSYGDEEMVQLVTEAGALAYLVKPLDVDQLVPAMQSALSRAEERRQLKSSVEQMDSALSQSREISMVVGILMERCNLSTIQAFDALRDEARSQRRKIVDVAKEYLHAAETLHNMSSRVADPPGKRRNAPPSAPASAFQRGSSSNPHCKLSASGIPCRVFRRSVRVVEGARLESVYTLIA
ncbi:MAG: ANTAR domain-containing response regulator, partial [Thiogranum sp.]